MTREMQARWTVWPVTLLAFVGHGWLVSQLFPAQGSLVIWLELSLSWSQSSAQWAAILLGVPLFAFFMAGIVLTVRVSAIAYRAISKGWL
jgi:hypothetical protein